MRYACVQDVPASWETYLGIVEGLREAPAGLADPRCRTDRRRLPHDRGLGVQSRMRPVPPRPATNARRRRRRPAESPADDPRAGGRTPAARVGGPAGGPPAARSCLAECWTVDRGRTITAECRPTTASSGRWRSAQRRHRHRQRSEGACPSPVAPASTERRRTCRPAGDDLWGIRRTLLGGEAGPALRLQPPQAPGRDSITTSAPGYRLNLDSTRSTAFASLGFSQRVGRRGRRDTIDWPRSSSSEPFRSGVARRSPTRSIPSSPPTRRAAWRSSGSCAWRSFWQPGSLSASTNG